MHAVIQHGSRALPVIILDYLLCTNTMVVLCFNKLHCKFTLLFWAGHENRDSNISSQNDIDILLYVCIHKRDYQGEE